MKSERFIKNAELKNVKSNEDEVKDNVHQLPEQTVITRRISTSIVDSGNLSGGQRQGQSSSGNNSGKMSGLFDRSSSSYGKNQLPPVPLDQFSNDFTCNLMALKPKDEDFFEEIRKVEGTKEVANVSCDFADFLKTDDQNVKSVLMLDKEKQEGEDNPFRMGIFFNTSMPLNKKSRSYRKKDEDIE